ncbi:MAG: hypothetical protein JWO08_1688 [Verrucomicrobiaceae bacterium]|nr:hypothetical protein [Verrucomicrobiaceae bacterium]
MSAPHKKTAADSHDAKADEAGRIKCGVVMPIAETEGLSAAHWADVLDIIKESLDPATYEVELVSADDVSGIIHKRIVQNLFANPIVICDVSARNPNVMFELGLRLAFDKPTIIIKDNVTPYSFDTGSIEHIPYPRDLRFQKMVEFKQKLAEKVAKTLEAAANDPQYSVFLKHFAVERPPASLPSEERGPWEIVMSELGQLRQDIAWARTSEKRSVRGLGTPSNGKKFRLRFRGSLEEIVSWHESLPGDFFGAVVSISDKTFIYTGLEENISYLTATATSLGLAVNVSEIGGG